MIEHGGGGVVVSLCGCPSSFVGLDGGRLVLFADIHPFCVVGGRRLWVVGVGAVFVCRPCLWSLLRWSGLFDFVW